MEGSAPGAGERKASVQGDLGRGRREWMQGAWCLMGDVAVRKWNGKGGCAVCVLHIFLCRLAKLTLKTGGGGGGGIYLKWKRKRKGSLVKKVLFLGRKGWWAHPRCLNRSRILAGGRLGAGAELCASPPCAVTLGMPGPLSVLVRAKGVCLAWSVGGLRMSEQSISSQ